MIRDDATSNQNAFNGASFQRSRTAEDLFRPGPHRLVDGVELLGEEVVGAGDDDALGVPHLLGQLLQLANFAVLVLRAVQEEDRLLAALEIAEVVLVDGGADEEDGVDVRQLAGHARGHPGAEGEAAHEELLPGMHLHHPVDGGHDVRLLPFARVVLAGARADAAEVEAERGHVGVLQPARGAEDDLVVQAPSAQRMRVADHRYACRVLQLAVKPLQPAGTGEEIDVAQRFRVHDTTFTRMRSPSMRTSCVATPTSGAPAHRPVVSSKPHRCHGQTISSPMTSPSASGPPRWGQVLSSAKNPLTVWKSAIRPPFASMAFALPAGRSAMGPASMRVSVTIYPERGRRTGGSEGSKRGDRGSSLLRSP